MIYQVKGKIVSNDQVNLKTYRMELSVPKISSLIKPGQFIHLRISGSTDPLLRRPFSVNKLVKNKTGKGVNILVLYEVVGKGTGLLSEKCCGEALDVLGPLGNGFVFNDLLLKDKQLVFAAGGMGIAPLLFLIEKIKPKLLKNKPLVFLGVRTKKYLACVDEFKKAGCAVKISTDDGSMGFQGKVTELLDKYLRESKDEIRRMIYACGPFPMLKSLSEISEKYGIPGQVSLDEMMGCGIGACLGCVVKARNTGSLIDDVEVYKRICKDGPVFDINDIIWEE